MEEGRKVAADALLEDAAANMANNLEAAEVALRGALDRAGGAVMFMTDRSCQDAVGAATIDVAAKAVLNLRIAVRDVALLRADAQGVPRRLGKMAGKEVPPDGQPESAEEFRERVRASGGDCGTGPAEPVQPGGVEPGDGGPGGGILKGRRADQVLVIEEGNIPPGCTRFYNVNDGCYEWRRANGDVVARELPGPKEGQAQGTPGRSAWLR